MLQGTIYNNQLELLFGKSTDYIQSFNDISEAPL